VRTLDEAAIAALRHSADRYVTNWQRFSRELKQIG
jgi:carbonic anhydrase/acetyltransferase-like protein (isoleucine patch superfamily)